MQLQTSAQTNDSLLIRNFFAEVLTRGQCYQTLDYLSNRIGGRLSGSPEAAAAVNYMKQTMANYGFDSVWLQEVMVPHWVRGEKEQAAMITGKERIPVNICALGNSVGTPEAGIEAQLIEVKSLEEVEKLGREKIQGKIVFFNRPMDPINIHTGTAYGG
ncbi:MAG: peptidase M28 family protein, partial [Bacteroidota bacterium]